MTTGQTRKEETQDSFIKDFEIFSVVEGFDHQQHYDYAKDKDGNLYKCCYGSDGDDERYITCYEDINGDLTNFLVSEMTFYQKTGRVPFDIIHDFAWKEVKGLQVEFKEIGGKERPCLIDWNQNKCYVIE